VVIRAEAATATRRFCATCVFIIFPYSIDADIMPEETGTLNYTKIDILIARAVPEEARVKGGEVYKECLREVWDMALRIGVEYGENSIARAWEEGFQEGFETGEANVRAIAAWEASNAAAKIAARHEEQLKEERVWGYNVGWALAQEVERTHRSSELSKAFILGPSLPSLSFVSTVATQTDPSVPLHSPQSDSTPTWLFSPLSHPVSELPPSANNDDFDVEAEVWHEAPEPPPDPSLPSPSPTTISARDFSDLRTETLRPFASLQRRHRRAPRGPGPCLSTPRSSRAPQTRTPQTTVLNIYDSKPKTPRA
jgi:hypothetical protein